MSRAYEMEIRVEGIKKDKIDAVLDFLKDEWFDEVVDDTRMEIENGICDNPDGNIKNGAWYPPDGTIDFSMRQVGYLCGGEGENEWAKRMYKGIREINDAKCKVEVEAVYLEDPPCETYSFGDDEDDKPETCPDCGESN